MVIRPIRFIFSSLPRNSDIRVSDCISNFVYGAKNLWGSWRGSGSYTLITTLRLLTGIVVEQGIESLQHTHTGAERAK